MASLGISFSELLVKSAHKMIPLKDSSSLKRMLTKVLRRFMCFQTKSNLPASTNVSVTKISQHLDLRQLADTNFKRYIGKVDRPLVLLFRWLYSNPNAVKKYCMLYHDIGLDVLTVKGKLAHFLWPPVGAKLAGELFDFLKLYRPPKEPLLIHAFSVGAYNYTIAMQEAAKNPEASIHFRNRVMGQIFDSLVIGSFDNMSRGIKQILPENEAFRKMVMKTLHSYYYVTQKTTRDTYDELVCLFKEDPIHVPTLFFYSMDDPLCDCEMVESMLAQWKKERPDFDVSSVSWQRSVHAAHLRFHREDYLATWVQLMERLQLV